MSDPKESSGAVYLSSDVDREASRVRHRRRLISAAAVAITVASDPDTQLILAEDERVRLRHGIHLEMNEGESTGRPTA
eukprot:CAMPEP_0194285374 /NCGR_PEP_ID=MMETSP0169-20130528/30025_1 /TAXON_ID=218684 /ORGANISM="Corethron pennatum, Strain L29A3" /LENGTH=77 /DNA_ID=CAMNT_0039031475 /DNA_START=179 /DNA_END=413 /DNA_ORIENTATION=-